jgi:hypothetical protein
MGRSIPIISTRFTCDDAKDPAIKKQQFCILGKYVEIKQDTAVADSEHHVHTFTLQDNCGTIPISYNFEECTERVFPFPCKLCALSKRENESKNNQENDDDVYVRVTRATLIDLGVVVGLRSECIEIVSEKNDALNHRIQHHLLSAQKEEHLFKPSATVKSFNPAEQKQGFLSTRNKNNNNNNIKKKDAFDEMLEGFNPKFSPLMYVFKNHVEAHEGILSKKQIAEYFNVESSVLLSSEELDNLIQEAVDYSMLNIDAGPDAFAINFSI